MTSSLVKRSSRSSRSSPPRPTSPASRRSPTAPPSCFGKVFGDAGVHARSAVGVPVLPLDSPGRGRDHGRGLSVRIPLRIPLPPADSSSTPGSTPTAPAHPPSRATRPRSCCCAPRTRGPVGLPAAPAGRRWRSPAGMCVFPGGGVDPRDFDGTVGWARAVAGRVGRGGSAPTRRPPGRWCARRCGRPSRSPACCSPARLAGLRGRGHHRRRLGGRPGRPGGARAVVDRVPLPARAGAAHRPARGLVGGWLTPVFEPRRYRTWFFVAAAARAASAPATSPSESSSVTWLPALAAPSTRWTPGSC